MAKVVRFRVLDGIAVVTLDAPPVNALSANLRGGLWQVFSRIAENDAIEAAVMMGAGQMFSAGADIREFGGAMVPPSLSQLCDHIEACPKPVIAALHGQVLGGGAELALAAHYRIATPDSRIGLPEVALGLVPGAGGTQRLPRLIGAEAALGAMVSTQSIETPLAHRIGLIDGVVNGDLGSGAMAFAQDILRKGQGPRPTRERREKLMDGRAHQDAVNKARASLQGNPLNAPSRVVDCVEAAGVLPFEAGLAFEEDAFTRCLAHPQSAALRHVFLAERRAGNALITRDGPVFKPADPAGKGVVADLRRNLKQSADFLAGAGFSEDAIDAALVDFGFRKGPFGGRDTAAGAPDITRRIVSAMMCEGARLLAEGAVARPSDIDALAVHGIGFPRRQGGPFRAAQSMGLLKLRSDLEVWAQEDTLWSVPDILSEAIKDAKGFDQFN